MPDTDPRPDDVITLPAAARLLRVGPTTLKRWSDQGRIPHTRTPGGHRRFLRSVILDFRALVDPRAGAGGLNNHLTLRMGEPREWVDRCNTLADADRMEAALLGLRASCADWGDAGDAVLGEFVDALHERRQAGRLSEGTWRAVRRSIVRSAQRAAGRLRPRIGAPVAVLASPTGGAADVLVALAEAVLRERGFTVLELGCRAEPAVLGQVIDEQQPHVVVLAADAKADVAQLAVRVRGTAGAALRSAAELWFVGDAEWPAVDGARPLASLAELGTCAQRRAARGEPPEPLAREG